jgi:hypothetical protein
MAPSYPHRPGGRRVVCPGAPAADDGGSGDQAVRVAVLAPCGQARLVARVTRLVAVAVPLLLISGLAPPPTGAMLGITVAFRDANLTKQT